MALYNFRPQSRPERVSRSEYLDELFAEAIKTANSSGNVSTVRGNFYENEIDRVLRVFKLSPTLNEKRAREKQYYCSFKIAAGSTANVE